MIPADFQENAGSVFSELRAAGIGFRGGYSHALNASSVADAARLTPESRIGNELQGGFQSAMVVSQ